MKHPSAFPSYKNADNGSQKRNYCRTMTSLTAGTCRNFRPMVLANSSTCHSPQIDKQTKTKSGTVEHHLLCSSKGCWMSGILLDGLQQFTSKCILKGGFTAVHCRKNLQGEMVARLPSPECQSTARFNFRKVHHAPQVFKAENSGKRMCFQSSVSATGMSLQVKM